MIGHQMFNIQIQWGSEYQPFECRKQLITEHFEVWISNGLVIKWLVDVTIQIPDLLFSD